MRYSVALSGAQGQSAGTPDEACVLLGRVVQRIEHGSPKADARVRIPPCPRRGRQRYLLSGRMRPEFRTPPLVAQMERRRLKSAHDAGSNPVGGSRIIERHTDPVRYMKISRRILALVAASFLLSACVSGSVENKRAPGEPSHKRYQLQIDTGNPLAPDELWVDVTHDEWTRCSMEEQYPGCRQ